MLLAGLAVRGKTLRGNPVRHGSCLRSRFSRLLAIAAAVTRPIRKPPAQAGGSRGDPRGLGQATSSRNVLCRTPLPSVAPARECGRAIARLGNPENTESFRGCRSPHPAAADAFHSLLMRREGSNGLPGGGCRPAITDSGIFNDEPQPAVGDKILHARMPPKNVSNALPAGLDDDGESQWLMLQL